MANIIEGYISGKNLKFGIVAARFNEFIVSKLVGGALDTLHRHETADSDIDVAWVPGAEWQIRGGTLPRGGHSWLDDTLRLRLQRGVEGGRTGWPPDGCSDDLWRGDDGEHRAGD